MIAKKTANSGLNVANLQSLSQWGFLPIWSGLQAPCVNPNDPAGLSFHQPQGSTSYDYFDPSKGWYLMDVNAARQQGMDEANMAAQRAQLLQLGNIVYYDLELYTAFATPTPQGQTAQVPCHTSVADNLKAVQSLLDGWITELHRLNFKAGIYINNANKSDFYSVTDPYIMGNPPDVTWVSYKGWPSNNNNNPAPKVPTATPPAWVTQWCIDGSRYPCSTGSIDPNVKVPIDKDLINGYVALFTTTSYPSVNLTATPTCNASGLEIDLNLIVNQTTEISFEVWRNGTSLTTGNTGVRYEDNDTVAANQSYRYYVIAQTAAGPIVSNTVYATAPSNCGTSFNHNNTTFPLTGAHTTVACASCHINNNHSGSLPTACYGCHQADFTGTTNPNHLTSGFPTDCTKCHTTTNWTSAVAANLAAQKAEKFLSGGLYGFGGKGFDYSGRTDLFSSSSPYYLSSENPCEVQASSTNTAVSPCWIVLEKINNTATAPTGYVYVASNTGDPAQGGGSASATACTGSGNTPCLDLRDHPEVLVGNPPEPQPHYDYGLDCSGLVMWSYNTATGDVIHAPEPADPTHLPIWEDGAGVAGDVIQSIVRSSGTVTVTTRAQSPLAAGDNVLIEGVADSGFNGQFLVTSSTSTPMLNEFKFTYAQAGAEASSSWGIATKLIAVQNGEWTTDPHGQCSGGESWGQSSLLTNNLGDISQQATYAPAPGEVLPGDLMCFRYYYKGVSQGGHVAMVVENGATVEALSRDYPLLPYQVGSTGTGKSNVLGRAFRDPAGDFNCMLPHGNFCFDFLGYRRPHPFIARFLTQGHSPISLSVTSPDGVTIDSKSWVSTAHDASRTSGTLSYNDYSTNGEDMVFSAALETGAYTIRPTPKPGAAPDSTYGLTVTVGGNTTTLAQDVPISQIPPMGYGVQSDGTGVIPVLRKKLE
jgi:cell wall-associated NlpC family hydrolase